MPRLAFDHISAGISPPPKPPNKTLERNRHRGVVGVLFHSGELVGFGGVALSWRSLSSAFSESSAFQRTDRDRGFLGDSCRPSLAGADRFPRYPETGGKLTLRDGELFADCFVFFGAHARSHPLKNSFASEAVPRNICFGLTDFESIQTQTSW